MKEEQTIFDELAELCAQPGYVHALAFLCFRDSMVRYSGKLKPSDIEHLFSHDRLIRTEIFTLIGLLIKNKIDFNLPGLEQLHRYVEQTDGLLKELHHAISRSAFGAFDWKRIAEEGFNPFSEGAALREPIFYGSESAYSSQYRDLTPRKYQLDEAWLRDKKGFSMQEACDVVVAIQEFQRQKMRDTFRGFRKLAPDKRTVLPAYTFTTNDIARISAVAASTVEKVLAAFVLPVHQQNSAFRAVHEFNAANAWPIILAEDGSFTSFHMHALFEAIYEAPFYWMVEDKGYVAPAMANRGRFAEQFSADRLQAVFGVENVHSNVVIADDKARQLGEIDVFVRFGDRAIILQAKSKRLTLEARKGNDKQLKSDFKKSVQDAYDQGHACAQTLAAGNCKLIGSDSQEIARPERLKEIYIICVVSDHYPALSSQSRQFLKTQQSDVIQPPFVMDVFALDVMVEMLSSPLRFLSYVNRRTNYSERILSTDELTILGFHLKYNLWLEDKYTMVHLADDFAMDLDISMSVRRDGIRGKRTPDGILTRFSSSSLGRLISEIEARPDPATIDLGFMLLTLSEDSFEAASKGIDYAVALARRDNKNHDFTLGVGRTGLTVHCNDESVPLAGPRLEAHCEVRKYAQSADSWYGVCISPVTGQVRFGVNLTSAWEHDAEMEMRVKGFNDMKGSFPSIPPTTRRKIGRNDPCSCGSGKKFKRCCLLN